MSQSAHWRKEDGKSGSGANSEFSIRIQCYFGELGTGMSEGKGTMAMFAGRHFDREVILLCVRWYLRPLC